MESKTKEKIEMLVTSFGLHNIIKRSTKKINSFEELMELYAHQPNKQVKRS